MPRAKTTASRCGALTADGTPCKRYAQENGRCRLHQGPERTEFTLKKPSNFALPKNPELRAKAEAVRARDWADYEARRKHLEERGLL